MSKNTFTEEEAKDLVKNIASNGVKKTKTPRQYDSILKGALALELKARVELKKRLQISIDEEVKHLKAAAERALEISNE